MASEFDAEAFVKNYCYAFGVGGGEDIGQFYSAPCLTVRGDGSLHVFTSHNEIDQFFGSVVATYRAEGMSGFACEHPSTEKLGSGCTRFTCEWIMQRTNMSVIRRWQQTYILRAIEEDWRIVVAIVHAT